MHAGHTFSYQLVFLLAVGAVCASGKLLLGASEGEIGLTARQIYRCVVAIVW